MRQLRAEIFASRRSADYSSCTPRIGVDNLQGFKVQEYLPCNAMELGRDGFNISRLSNVKFPSGCIAFSSYYPSRNSMSSSKMTHHKRPKTFGLRLLIYSKNALFLAIWSLDVVSLLELWRTMRRHSNFPHVFGSSQKLSIRWSSVLKTLRGQWNY